MDLLFEAKYECCFPFPCICHGNSTLFWGVKVIWISIIIFWQVPTQNYPWHSARLWWNHITRSGAQTSTFGPKRLPLLPFGKTEIYKHVEWCPWQQCLVAVKAWGWVNEEGREEVQGMVGWPIRTGREAKLWRVERVCWQGRGKNCERKESQN